MTTVELRGTIGADGHLRLDVPVDLPAGLAEVLVVVQPVATPPISDGTVNRPLPSARSGLFVDDPAFHELDIDAVRKEINDAWKKKLMEGL